VISSRQVPLLDVSPALTLGLQGSTGKIKSTLASVTIGFLSSLRIQRLLDLPLRLRYSVFTPSTSEFFILVSKWGTLMCVLIANHTQQEEACVKSSTLYFIISATEASSSALNSTFLKAVCHQTPLQSEYRPQTWFLGSRKRHSLWPLHDIPRVLLHHLFILGATHKSVVIEPLFLLVAALVWCRRIINWAGICFRRI
jgi:hypothetical protein